MAHCGDLCQSAYIEVINLDAICLRFSANGLSMRIADVGMCSFKCEI